jgi:hypothetical protein
LDPGGFETPRRLSLQDGVAPTGGDRGADLPGREPTKDFTELFSKLVEPGFLHITSQTSVGILGVIYGQFPEGLSGPESGKETMGLVLFLDEDDAEGYGLLGPGLSVSDRKSRKQAPKAQKHQHSKES